MQTQLVAVGNSKGLRLPKALLAQCGIEDTVSLKVTDAGLLISPARSPRLGWENAILAERACDPEVDMQLWAALPNAFDDVEWTWPQQKV